MRAKFGSAMAGHGEQEVMGEIAGLADHGAHFTPSSGRALRTRMSFAPALCRARSVIARTRPGSQFACRREQP